MTKAKRVQEETSMGMNFKIVGKNLIKKGNFNQKRRDK